MSKLPTLQEFVQRAIDEFGAKEKNLALIPGLPVESKQRLNQRYLERWVGPNQWVEVMLPNIPEETELLPTTLLGLCRGLRLNPADFGLTLN